MAINYPIPEAITTLGSVQLLFNYLNQTGLKIFTNNPGPDDTNYKDIINLANGINSKVKSVRDVIDSLVTLLPKLQTYLPIGVKSITVSGTTATVTTGNATEEIPHGFSTGNKVIISNSSVSGLNTPINSITTITVPGGSTTTFTYTVTSGTSADPTSSASVQCYSLT